MKSFVTTLLVGAMLPVDAKIRPMVQQRDFLADAPAIVKSHERKVREPLVQKCSHQYVSSPAEPIVGATVNCQ